MKCKICGREAMEETHLCHDHLNEFVRSEYRWGHANNTKDIALADFVRRKLAEAFNGQK